MRLRLAVIALLAAVALAPSAASAQVVVLPEPVAPINVPMVVEIDREAMMGLLAGAVAWFEVATPPQSLLARQPQCANMPLQMTARAAYGILGEAVRDALEAVRVGDVEAFRQAKTVAYTVIACYPELPSDARLTAMRLVAAEPADPAMNAFLVHSGVVAGSGVPPAPPAPPPAVTPVQPGEPGQPGGSGRGIGPAESPSGGGGGGGLEIPRSTGGSLVDVERLIRILEEVKSASAITAGQPVIPRIPSPPTPDERLLALAALAAAAYAARGRARYIASALRGLRLPFPRHPVLLDARKCYRLAISRAETITGVRKRASDTPSEYLAAVAPLLGPIEAAALSRATLAYEEQVYAMRERRLPRAICELEEA